MLKTLKYIILTLKPFQEKMYFGLFKLRNILKITFKKLNKFGLAKSINTCYFQLYRLNFHLIN